MPKFVKNTQEINALQTLAIMEDGRPVPAKTRGGRSSLSGKTSTPTWVEKEGFSILRKDAFLTKIWMSLREGTPHEVEHPYFFEGHGTSWREVTKVDIPALEIALTSWMKFRKEGESLPPSSSLEEKMAREYSLASFRTEGFITQFEAMELLPQWSLWAELEEDEEDGYFTIWAEKGHAWTSGEFFKFVPELYLYTWEDEEGWGYSSCLSCTDRRWYRYRQRKEVMERETEEDSWIWEKI